MQVAHVCSLLVYRLTGTWIDKSKLVACFGSLGVGPFMLAIHKSLQGSSIAKSIANLVFHIASV